MGLLHKVLVNLTVLAVFLIVFYCFQTPSSAPATFYRNTESRNELAKTPNVSSAVALASRKEINDEYYNVWCIFTKVTSNSPLRRKFKIFTASMLKLTSVNLAFHVISDPASREIAEPLIQGVIATSGKSMKVTYYDVHVLAKQLEDIVSTMSPYFSSNPGTYYSDALFFLSLGLHRIAPENQKKAAMFDADTKFRTDIKELFEEFNKFGPEALFGLAPELTPVYRHVLYLYRSKNPGTLFGEPAYLGGFPGFNSGMVLFNFEKLRESLEYDNILSMDSVDHMTQKYYFKGHLGDQDFYTILGMERPELIHKVDCGWNRQLCTWWGEHGYSDVFANYSHCDARVKLWHGNCNTAIPDD
ncbi:xyloside xylosyltransferase 1 [Neodiprion virginianus]|uniref:xyloside xylosyltransferase 1 n=1 Tax=Neodiprion virginianus TaxID=2961670 RepID=UPI001EE72217|nr:xyloside xylosyltransferase 1 [Neodiprion virginianus]